MVVLNKAKSIRVGGGLVKTVTVGTRKIWPSRTIAGYRVVATFTSRARYTSKVFTQNGEQELLKPYIDVEGLMIRVKGGSQMLPVTGIGIGPYGKIYTDGNPIDLGIKKGTVCELLAPIYST